MRVDRFQQQTLQVPSPLLAEIFATASVTDRAGNQLPLHGNISVEHTNALYRTVRKVRPNVVVEIGMAFGIASLAIATALDEIGADGQLISVDPNQTRTWKNIGVLNLRRAGLADHHRLIQRVDYLALPQLVLDGNAVQFAYIDGWHTFDYTLLDFFYLDKLLAPGGVVAFNDCGMPSVRKVTRFVTAHRRYRELDVGLKRRYVSRDLRATVRRLATMRSKTDRYFEKLETWEPPSDFYARF